MRSRRRFTERAAPRWSARTSRWLLRYPADRASPSCWSAAKRPPVANRRERRYRTLSAVIPAVANSGKEFQTWIRCGGSRRPPGETRRPLARGSTPSAGNRKATRGGRLEGLCILIPPPKAYRRLRRRSASRGRRGTPRSGAGGAGVHLRLGTSTYTGVIPFLHDRLRPRQSGAPASPAPRLRWHRPGTDPSPRLPGSRGDQQIARNDCSPTVPLRYRPAMERLKSGTCAAIEIAAGAFLFRSNERLVVN